MKSIPVYNWEEDHKFLIDSLKKNHVVQCDGCTRVTLVEYLLKRDYMVTVKAIYYPTSWEVKID
jgi:hypothetical protein